MVELDDGAEVLDVFAHKAERKRLVVTTAARGFVVGEDQLLSSTRKGRQVVNLDDAQVLKFAEVSGDTVAVVGENRKLLLFPLAQVAEMGRGSGVRLQRYKEGGVADAKVFALAEGLSFTTNGGVARLVKGEELRDWLGNRAEAGRLPPHGFPKSNRFGG